MSEYKIITSDLDGTLLDKNQMLSEENSAAITELTSKGYDFIPCTGRTMSLIITEVKDHPCVRYIIYSNGAVIYDKKTGKCETTYFSKEQKSALFDILGKQDCLIIGHIGGVSYIDREKNNKEAFLRYRLNDYYQELYNYGSSSTEDIRELALARDDVEMFFIKFKSNDDLYRAKKELDEIDGLYVTNSTDASLEIITNNAGKGNALIRLAEMLGSSTEQIIAIGDSPNDYTMLKTAGLALAVSNAADVLKAIADEVICSNDEHAAKYVLEKYNKVK